MELLYEAMRGEVRELRTWYDLAVTESGRTTVGVSELDPEAVGAFIGEFLEGDAPVSPRDDIAVLPLFKLALEDLKAYYFEAMAAQPGQKSATSTMLADWFWRDTAAGKVMFTLQEFWKDSDDGSMKLFSQLFMVPHVYHADSPYIGTGG